jgi:hypothetical protein
MKQRLFVACVVILAACTKSNDSATVSATSKTSLLTAKVWVLTSSQYKSTSATTWTDQYALMGSCDRDNQIVFKTDGTYEVNEGATKCNAANPYTIETGTWKFAQNETIITLVTVVNGSPVNKDATIDALSESSFAYTYVKAVSGVNYTIKESYGH